MTGPEQKLMENLFEELGRVPTGTELYACPALVKQKIISIEFKRRLPDLSEWLQTNAESFVCNQEIVEKLVLTKDRVVDPLPPGYMFAHDSIYFGASK